MTLTLSEKYRLGLFKPQTTPGSLPDINIGEAWKTISPQASQYASTQFTAPSTGTPDMGIQMKDYAADLDEYYKSLTSQMTQPKTSVNPVKDKETGTGNEMELDAGQKQRPLFATPDLATYANILGNSIGNAGTKQGGGANIVAGIGAGLGLTTGLARGIMGGMANAKYNNQMYEDEQKRLQKAREGEPVKIGALGGEMGGFLGAGEQLPIVGASGEYIAPSDDTNTRQEVEKGEVIQIDGDPLTKEALGEKHENGGTPVSLPPHSRVLSDHLTLSDSLAKDMRERYGIKVTPKTTYAEASLKYKQKIGLQDALDEMEELTKRLEKNQKVQDRDTRLLNETVLSDHMTELQQKIDGLSTIDKEFFDVVYQHQEDSKEKEVSNYLEDGGEIDRSAVVEETSKQFNISKEEAEAIYDKVVEKQKMALGGTPTNYMQFVPIQNRFNNADNNFGFQRRNEDGTYGDIGTWGADAIGELAKLHPTLTRGENPVITVVNGVAGWTNPNDTESNARAIESVVNQTSSGFQAISDLIPNRKDAIDYWTQMQFSDASQKGPSDSPYTSNSAYNSRTAESKLGAYHLSRPTAGLRVVDKFQLQKLNDAGIRNYSDLMVNEKQARDILKGDYDELMKLRDRAGAKNLDFVIMDYDPTTPIEARNLGMAPNPEIPDKFVGITPKQQTTEPETPEEVKDEKDKEKEKGKKNTNGAGNDFMALSDYPILPPSARSSTYLNQMDYMRTDPAIRSAEQYMMEMDRSVNAQLNALGDVPDSQRGAILSNLNAVAAQNKAKFLSEVDAYNAQAITGARDANNQRYMQTSYTNAGLRGQYEDTVARDIAAQEAQEFNYYENLRDTAMAKDEARIQGNILRSIYPNARLTPSGQILYNPTSDMVFSQGYVPWANMPDEVLAEATAEQKKRKELKKAKK